MRRAARTDRNQAEIVEALRMAGATVQPLHAVGKGCPDLLVGFRGDNFMLEVKDPKQTTQNQRLKPDQEIWHTDWRGQVAVVKTIKEALKEIGALAE